jgi:SpoVK/Ycf46/Vps4 family AAA+-type ATPase
VEIFRRTIQRSLGQGEEPIEKTFEMIDSPVVIIINDLELWWERREGGSGVINQLTEWIRNYGKKVLFLLNLNIHALNLINQLTQVSSWSIGTVVCTGLDARQIKEMIMLRHQAGGMSFILDKKHETEMNAWRYARLFNRYFDVTKGNPGFAINLWIASVKKVSGKTIYIQKPPALDTSFLSKLSKEQIYFLLQFVYHLRLSVDDLSRMTLEDKEIITNKIFNLWHSGILSEKFPGVYAINTLLHIPLIEKMKEMNILE